MSFRLHAYFVRGSKRGDNLCLDIGNSFTSAAVFRNRRLLLKKGLSNNEFPKFVENILKNGRLNLKYASISSVVPKITSKIRKILGKNKGLKLILVQPRLLEGIQFKYKSLNRLGNDRAINAYGAHYLVGGNCLVADFGTALTLDFVSKKGVFEGGLIFPGLSTALSSLHEKAALLPRISLAGPVPFPGRSTEDCMRSGIFRGFAALTKGVYDDFKKRYALKKCTLIVTGGHANWMRPFLRGLPSVLFDPLFTLKSMNCFLSNFSTSCYSSDSRKIEL